MKSEEAKRALEILDDAHGLSAHELESYLDSVCGEDSLLRREVLSYLEYDGTGTVLPAGVDVGTAPEIPQAPVSETRYDLGDEIARGGIGVVLRAFDNNIRRDVAVKVLQSEWERKPEIVHRFLQEARIGGQLQHPGIAPVYEIGRLPDGRPFIAMKLIKGETLEDLLARRRDANDDQAKLLGIFEEVCQAIAFAHTCGVIHRDLKPSNVMVGEFGEVQVMDWGIAKLLSDDEPEAPQNEGLSHADTPASDRVEVDTDGIGHHTRVGQLMGTPAYMAPEQSIGRADRTADVFALGAILFEILTGEKPPGDADAAREQLDRCQCDQELAELAKDCLQRNEADRPQDAGVVATRISAHFSALQSRLKEAEIATARAEVKAEEERKRRHRTLWTIAAVAILLVVAALIVLLLRNAVIQRQEAARADGLVDQLLIADIRQVPSILENIEPYREWVAARLSTEFEQSEPGSIERLHSALALPSGDGRRLRYLRDHLLRATPKQFPVVRAALLPHKDQIADSLWQTAQNEEHDATGRFQAAAALAEYNPDDERWSKLAPFMAEHLTDAIPYAYLGQWLEHLQSARHHLTDPLAVIFTDRSRPERQREVVALALADYWYDEPEKLVDIILIADEAAEFAPLIAALQPHGKTVEQQLIAEMRGAMPKESSRPQRDAHWTRQSLAAVTLVQLGYGDEAWPLLQLTADPSLRSFIIYHLGKLQTDHNTLAARLAVEREVSIRRALIQSLGGLNLTRIPTTDRNRIAEQLRALYTSDPDPGIHSSASWTLRQWGVALPELPINEPVMTDEQRQRIADLTEARRAAWERQLREQMQGMSASLSQHLVAHYPLDESKGTETANVRDGQLKATYQGPGQPNWVPGVVDGALRLDGEGGHINCGNEFSPERTDEFSYGCWFHAAPNSGKTCLFSKMGLTAEGTRGGFNVHIVADKLVFGLTHEFPENRLAITASVDHLLGSWHHVFVTYDGSSTASGVRIFVDGRLASSKVAAESLTKSIQNAGPLQIGRQSTDWSSQCRIDDVRIYDRQIGEDAILALYRSGLSALALVPTEDRTTDQQTLLRAAYDPAIHGPRSQGPQSPLSLAEKTLLEEWEKVRRWYVNSQGQTMAVISNPPASGITGIDYDFAIASHEVTVAEFLRFREGHDVYHLATPTEDCPVGNVSWNMAAEYCNWLSEQEAIPEDQWVYERISDDPADGMKSKENYLELRGYRLPTSAEWEHACRAGTRGTYSFGESAILTPRYFHFGGGSAVAVGTLLPNDAGLFDMHGNVKECCHDALASGYRVLRGGSFASGLPEHKAYADTRFPSIGFRVARTHR
jgi:hypothetical protein